MRPLISREYRTLCVPKAKEVLWYQYNVKGKLVKLHPGKIRKFFSVRLTERAYSVLLGAI